MTYDETIQDEVDHECSIAYQAGIEKGREDQQATIDKLVEGLERVISYEIFNDEIQSQIRDLVNSVKGKSDEA